MRSSICEAWPGASAELCVAFVLWRQLFTLPKLTQNTSLIFSYSVSCRVLPVSWILRPEKARPRRSRLSSWPSRHLQPTMEHPITPRNRSYTKVIGKAAQHIILSNQPQRIVETLKAWPQGKNSFRSARSTPSEASCPWAALGSTPQKCISRFALEAVGVSSAALTSSTTSNPPLTHLCLLKFSSVHRLSAPITSPTDLRRPFSDSTIHARGTFSPMAERPLLLVVLRR